MSSMFRILAVVLGMALASPGDAVPAATTPKSLQKGDAAVPFVAETLRRQTIDLEDHRGKVVLLQFWASWCSGCVEGLPDLRALYEKHSRNGFEIVGISLDEDPRAARRTLAEFGVSWPQVCDGKGHDGDIATRYGVRGTPRFVLIGRDGRIQAPYVRPSELDHAVSALLESE